ncbi:hypothetical protein [Serratia ureilytica]|uniref:hypothetical protein n=1 Tax=Serratia ureilytica TaxID=300181 RepID=UPI001E412505|nr:hypothetical protein [Serratia ureilytica]
MQAVGDNDYFVGIGVGIFIAVARFKIGDSDIDKADSFAAKTGRRAFLRPGLIDELPDADSGIGTLAENINFHFIIIP